MLMRWIKAIQLEDWARSIPARDAFPGLVSDLIRASSRDVMSMRFPSGDKGQVRGFDGYLVSNASSLNIPLGKSIWEFGTNEDYRTKANSDFKKRTNEVSKADQADTTYVFISPWTWDSSDKKSKLEDWVAARKAESSWKEILYIDGSALETWLDDTPAVAAWHARNTLKISAVTGIRSTDEFWDHFAGQFEPRVTPEVLLCERDDYRQLIASLLQPESSVALVADSPDEVVAFAIAAMQASRPEIRLMFEARTLVVDSVAAGRELTGPGNLILLLRNDAATSPSQFQKFGSALVPLGRQQRGGNAPALPRPSGFAMGAAMRSMGLDEAKALMHARGSGRSLTALARLIPGGSFEDPKWIAKGQELLPAILAGAWDNGNALDREIIEMIAGGTAHSTVEGHARGFLRNPDPPLDLEGTIWKVRAPMDAFIRIGHLIGLDESSRLRDAMLAVFSRVEEEPDPEKQSFFPPRESTGHSDWLREGLATTLLLFATWSKEADINLGGQTGQQFADRLFGDIPSLASDPRILASLKNELPLLAEAAPDPLLSALERMLEGTGAAILPIFEEKKGFLYPSYNHTGLLWALETIAWDPKYFKRAVMALAKLAAIGPEIKILNTPANSLAEIFIPWNPSTNASAAQRLSALKEITTAYPEAGWTLIHKLLPNALGSSTATHRPKIRDVGPANRTDVSVEERHENEAAIAELAVGLAGDDEGRWIDLIGGIGNFSPTQRSLAIDALDRMMSGAGDAKRKRLWMKVRDEAARHERFKAAAWTLSESELAPLVALVKKYAPDDPVVAAAEVFNEWTLDQRRDFGKSHTERIEAVRRLYESAGPEAVLKLTDEARVPHLVMEAIVGAGLGAAQIEELLSLSIARDRKSSVTRTLAGLYRGVVGVERAEAWLRAAAKGDVDFIADIVQAWPDGTETWNVVRGFGSDAVNAYWTKRAPMYMKGSRRTLLRSLLMFLRYGRALEAIQASLDRLPEVPTRLLMRMLDGVTHQLNRKKAVADTMTAHYVETAFAALDSRTDVEQEDIALREFAFFPLLEYGNRSLRINALMAADPAFYHRVLRNVFHDDRKEPTELNENEKIDARVSWSLLSNFKSVPGATPDGIDAPTLGSWIAAVRHLGEETGRAAVTDNYIGRLLAHAPTDRDGGWPHRAVRDQIELLKSDELERGIKLARYNMRGVHGKPIYEGGDQERALARDNFKNAELAGAWPRTSVMLAAIAKSWEADAEREDVEAAQRKMRS
jgi:hypothetical protein